LDCTNVSKIPYRMRDARLRPSNPPARECESLMIRPSANLSTRWNKVFELARPTVGRAGVLAAAVGLLSTGSPGQSLTPPPRPTSGPSAAASPQSGPGQIDGLAQTPLVIDELGLLINLPADASVVAERVDETLSIAVRDPADPPTWTMRIQRMTSSLAQPSAAGQILDHLETLKASKEVFKMIANREVDYGGALGQLCFIEKRANDEPLIFGWLVITTGPRQFLVFSINALPSRFDRLKPLLESSFATISLRAAGEIDAERKTRIDAATQLLAGLTPAGLRSQVGVTQWFRIYIPATEKQREIERGYSCLSVFEAGKDALDIKNSPDLATGSEKGMLVQLRGRLVNPEATVYYDSEARYWMAWDQSEEQWSIVGTQRQGEAEATESELGVRSKATPGAAPRITVQKVDHATNTSEPHDWDVPEAYLSQALGWVLPRLMPRDATSPREFGFYFYNFANSRPQISLRSDLWEPLNDGGFRMTTKLTSDSPPTISMYAADGTLIRRMFADGSITEPTTLEDLRRIWKAKGLSVSKNSR
jgi:hypothetical protein